MSGMMEALEQSVEVVCLDGPHTARGPPTPDVSRFFQPPFYEWWDAVKDPGTNVVTYVGAEQSLALLERQLRAAAAVGQPVCGLLGFSQGAALAALVVAMQERGERFQDVPRLQAAVLISGNAVRDPAYAHVYSSSTPALTSPAAAAIAGAVVASERGVHPSSKQQQQPQASQSTSPPVRPPPPALVCPSCHLIGSADSMRGLSERLASSFAEPLMLRHSQGHVVPRLAPEQQEQLEVFLRNSLAPQQHPTPLSQL